MGNTPHGMLSERGLLDGGGGLSGGGNIPGGGIYLSSFKHQWLLASKTEQIKYIHKAIMLDVK